MRVGQPSIPPGGEYYVFRDNVHNLIAVEDADEGTALRRVLRTQEVQRLRHIHQNGLASLVYPGMEHSRFAHSLGTFAIARKIIHNLGERQPGKENGMPMVLQLDHRRDYPAFCFAALLHDIGHSPFSHVWEEFMDEEYGEYPDKPQGRLHEAIGHRILEDNHSELGKLLGTENKKYPSFGPRLRDDILRLLKGCYHIPYLNALLAGDLDVDRLDFVARDTRMAGVSYGFHELDWIIRSLRIVRSQGRSGESPSWLLAVDGRKGLFTLVQFLRARANMYRQVYFHKTVRAAVWTFRSILLRAIKLGTDAVSPPFSTFLKNPTGFPLLSYTDLDDGDVITSIKNWARNHDDPILARLSSELLERTLFKPIVVSESVYNNLEHLEDHIKQKIAARLNCTVDESHYFYALDKRSTSFVNTIRPLWLLKSGKYGPVCESLEEFWNREMGQQKTPWQYLLIAHREVVSDLQQLVRRLDTTRYGTVRTQGGQQEVAEPFADDLPDSPTNEYRILGRLGKGTFKETFVASQMDLHKPTLVALKRLDAAPNALPADVRVFRLMDDRVESITWTAVAHQEGTELWIVEDLWDGTLKDVVLEQGPITDLRQLLEMTYQLFSGLAYLAKKNIRHTDLKPDNCGFVRHEDRVLFKVGDFGCASTASATLPENEGSLGTPKTRPPEIFTRTGISCVSDVWSLAATIYSVSMRRYPFADFDVDLGDLMSDKRRKHVEYTRANIEQLTTEFREAVNSRLPSMTALRRIHSMG